MMGGVQRHGMGLRPPGDGPRGDHRALFAVNDHDLACVTHDYKQSWRRRIEREASRIQAVDLDASRELPFFMSTISIDPFAPLF